jgi:hypothetical protein
MNAIVHSELSVKRRGGILENYVALHDFCDSSKEVESTNKHRIYFHTLFGVKNFIIPIFGHTIINSDGKRANVKDLCEQDHILPDYRGRFIPTLTDFIDCVEDSEDDKDLLENFYQENSNFFMRNPNIRDLLMLPLWNTGKIKSLLLTHNSWFLGFVLPKIFKDIELDIRDFNINPAVLFNRMEYKTWMSNGVSTPPSFKRVEESKNTKIETILLDKPLDVTYDGSR